MTNTDDDETAKDAMSNFPVDNTSFENLAKSQAALAEKMSAVAIEAAQKSTDLSARWVQDTLSKLSTVTAAKADPADYAKSVTDFVSASAETAAEHMAAYAEIAKKVQAETLELLLAAGKDMSEDVTAAARKAGEDMTSAARKATEDFTAAARKSTSTSTNV